MLSSNVLIGQSVRFLRITANESTGDKTLYDLLHGLETQYKFLEVPKDRSQMNFTKGVRFSGGIFEGKDIERIEIYGDGIICEARADTVFCDMLVDNIIEWIYSSRMVKIEEATEIPRIYTSHIEFNAELPLDLGSSPLAMAARMVSEFWTDYGHESRAFFVTGTVFDVEMTNVTGITPQQFLLERRVGQTFDKNAYFSRAPLKTTDHLSLLEQIEQAFNS